MSFSGRKSRGFGYTLIVAILACGSGLLITGLSETAPEAQAEGAAAPSEFGKPPQSGPEGEVASSERPKPVKITCAADETVIDDLRKQKSLLDQRMKEMAQKETDLKSREAALDEELKKIEIVRDEIKAASGVVDSRSEEKITKLVETFESMSPKAGAQIMANLDERLAVQSMTRLSSVKLGKILSAMDPKKSTSLSELMAGVVRARHSTTSHGVAETTGIIRNGGEIENGNIKTNNGSNQSGQQPQPALGRDPASP